MAKCECGECVNCRNRAWYARNKTKQQAYRKEYYKNNKALYRKLNLKSLSSLEGFLRHKLSMAKRRAKKRAESFDLTLEQLMFIWNEQAGRCALTGVEMTRDLGEGWKPTNASLDRIDSNGIYTKGNVRLLCDMVNRMKSEATDDELLEWCRRILN